jgi:hypothetical protein
MVEEINKANARGDFAWLKPALADFRRVFRHTHRAIERDANDVKLGGIAPGKVWRKLSSTHFLFPISCSSRAYSWERREKLIDFFHSLCQPLV